MSIKSLSGYCFAIAIEGPGLTELSFWLSHSWHADPAIFSEHFVHHLESR